MIGDDRVGSQKFSLLRFHARDAAPLTADGPNLRLKLEFDASLFGPHGQRLRDCSNTSGGVIGAHLMDESRDKSHGAGRLSR